jgi:cytochrome c-type biogenesis protein CcmH/NrfG
MDPARSETPASDALTGAERDARIEQLLLTGLDHYFANDYEEAINLWTRVLFLDRHHDRARAYIERARSAQAEKQRESEALMHQGLDAFTSGDVERARQLVGDALAKGASRDLALGVLDRIERLGEPKPADGVRRTRARKTRAARTADDGAAADERQDSRFGIASLLLMLAALGAAAVAVWGVTLPDVSGWTFTRDAARTAPIVAPAAEPLPLPSSSELYLSRGRTMFRSGRLRDALRELDRVPIGDTGRAEADRLRAQIQRELLAVAADSRLSVPSR